jgi:hypothetical protein
VSAVATFGDILAMLPPNLSGQLVASLVDSGHRALVRIGGVEAVSRSPHLGVDLGLLIGSALP